jgi:hypothetical protein
MISPEGIEQILAQYAKHGWKLRRVLLSGRLKEKVPGIADWFEGVEIQAADLDGLWFSRSSRPDITAWELRHLAETPYALVTAVQEGTNRETAESILKETQSRMMDAIGWRTARPPE